MGGNTAQPNFNIKRLYSQKTLEYAKELRKTMTEAESVLWFYLKKRQMCGVKFRKQSPIGKYIVDFVSYEKKLIIELDGGQHLENKQKLHDEIRDKFLANAGFTVKRYFDNDVFNNTELVLEDIYRYIESPNPGSPDSSEGKIADHKLNSFFDFLETRKGKLDAVVITGGEPTLQKDLKEVITKIKQMGFLVKLDTNGYKPEILEELLNENLIDYVAMDIKAPLEKYSFVTNIDIDTDKIQKSIDLIMQSGVDYEFRTTFLPYYHKIEDFEKIGELIKGAKHYYLQKFEAQSEINNEELRSEKNYSPEDIQKILDILKKYIEFVEVR